jgi:ubiquinone/menaquinone biosynthesis C-methylase UbiE
VHVERADPLPGRCPAEGIAGRNSAQGQGNDPSALVGFFAPGKSTREGLASISGARASGWRWVGLRVERVPDAIFEHPRLASIYDALDPDRSDLDVYVAIAGEVGAHRVLDVGCGTGAFALLLAERDMEVTGVDPAKASLDVARAKPGAERVRWIHGDASALPGLQVDLATMTGNVAQTLVEPTDWAATLRGVYDALRPGGYLVFESRDPAHRGWREWNRDDSYAVTEIPGVGAVESWVELTEVALPLVSFRWTYVFAADGLVLTSDSTLRFPERAEVEAALIGHGYSVEEVRDAPDRPGREFVFFARRPG